MQNEQSFTQEESLKLITEMIGKAKRSYVTKGIAAIVWGTIIVTCSIISWLQYTYKLHIRFNIWWLTVFALLPQIYFGIKEKQQKKFTSHNETAIRFVWIAFGICIFITSFYTGNHSDYQTTTLFMMLYGIPTFVTGGVTGFKPMIIGGILCWLIAVISIYTSFGANLLLMAACGLFAWFIPGIILWGRYKQQQQVNV